MQSDAIAQHGFPTFPHINLMQKAIHYFALIAKTDIYKSADSTSKIIAGCNAGDTLFIFETGVVNNENYQLPEYYK